MIVRISGEGQWRVTDAVARELNALDNRIVAAINDNNQLEYRQLLENICDAVRQRGERYPDDHLGPSDIIIPPPDLPFAAARDLFTGEGIIADTT